VPLCESALPPLGCLNRWPLQSVNTVALGKSGTSHALRGKLRTRIVARDSARPDGDARSTASENREPPEPGDQSIRPNRAPKRGRSPSSSSSSSSASSSSPGEPGAKRGAVNKPSPHSSSSSSSQEEDPNVTISSDVLAAPSEGAPLEDWLRDSQDSSDPPFPSTTEAGAASFPTTKTTTTTTTASSPARAEPPLKEVEDAEAERYRVAGVAPLANLPVPPGAVDLDFTLGNRPDYAPRLGACIIDHYRLIEVELRPDPDYFVTMQTSVTPSSRAILVDWMVTLHSAWHLRAETMYAAVQLVDRYLSRHIVDRARLQLVAVAALMISCKLEEQNPPGIADFVAACRDAFTDRDILRAELLICRRLGWRLRSVTTRTFLARFLDAGGARCADSQANLTKFYCELALMEARFIRYPPSLLCAAAVYAARRQLGLLQGGVMWTPTLERFTGYSEADVTEPAREMLWAHRDSADLKVSGVVSKYSRSSYGCVATTTTPIATTVANVSPPELLVEFPPDEPSHSCVAKKKRKPE
jgi:transcription initiation factor TFIIIB Brf1 subunit/transcription initiation factor TFIIB